MNCHKCGEPWYLDTFHEYLAEVYYGDKPWKQGGKHDQELYERVYFNPLIQKFAREGCQAIEATCNPDTVGDPIIAVVQDLLGDDVDAIEAELSDMGLF